MNWQKVIEVLRHRADVKHVIMEAIYKSGVSTEGVDSLATQVGLLRCIADALEVGIETDVEVVNPHRLTDKGVKNLTSGEK